MPRSLGDFFSQNAFTVEEKRRLAVLVAEHESAAAPILKTHVTKLTAYRETFRKAEGLQGFRPGARHYHEKALPRLIRHLGDADHPRHKLCWELYKAAAIDFIKKDLPTLDKLLSTVPLPQGEATATEALKLVCSRAVEFDVSLEQLLTFYKIWCLPRVEEPEATLCAWMAADEGTARKHELGKLRSELEALRNTVRHLSSQLASQTNTLSLESAERERAQFLEQKLRSEHVRLLETTAGLELKIKALEDQASRLSARVADANRDGLSATKMKTAFDKQVADLKATIPGTVSALKEELTSSMQEDLAEATAAIESRFASLAADIFRKRDDPKSSVGAQAPMRYRSPLVGMLSQGSPTHKLVSELDFINSWIHHLSATWDTILSIEHALACHRAFLANYVVIAERPLVQSWIDCLAWQSFTLHIAASPTWSSEEDWAKAAEHLFCSDQVRAPKFVVLHNYDVGLTDCYLSPSLALWALRGPSRGLAKLFLIPSGTGQLPGPQLIEHTILCSGPAHPAERVVHLRDEIRLPEPLRRDPQIGVDPKLASQWLQSSSPIDYDLNTLGKALNLHFGLCIVTNFKRTASFAARYLDDASAVRIALHCQLVPWVKARYGETKSDELQTFLSHLPEGGY